MKDEPMWHLEEPAREEDGLPGKQYDFQTAIDLAAWMRRHMDSGEVMVIWHSYEL